MAVTGNDCKIFAPLTVNNTDSNGGRIDLNNELISGALNVTFDDVGTDEREAGSEVFRKIFLAAYSANNDASITNHAWLHKPTPADDFAELYAGTATDTQATLDTTNKFVSGSLASDIDANATQLVINLESVEQTSGFRVGELLIISNKLFPSSVDGTAVKRTISAINSVVSNVVTLTLTENVGTAFTAGASVSSIFSFGTLKANAGTVVVTSASGTFDSENYEVECDNQGTIDETITLTFSSSTAFTCAGSVSGNHGAGTISADFSPVNPVNGRNICTISSLSFGGTFTNGDTIQIPLNSAFQGIWQKRKTPPLSEEFSQNIITLGWSFEAG